jgi:hypothetical protein
MAASGKCVNGNCAEDEFDFRNGLGLETLITRDEDIDRAARSLKAAIERSACRISSSR